MSLIRGENRPFRIFLGDLEYDTIYTTMTVPINIGYFASFLDKEFGEKVEITLFKYPTKLDGAINDNPPDMLGLSNYIWNARLDEVFFDKVKRLNPKAVTVMGGPNIRRKPQGIHDFLKKHPSLNYYIMDYGEEPEQSLAGLVGELLEGNNKPHSTGCATISDGKFYFEAKSWSKESRQIKLPSPYLSGYLDEFLEDPKLIPMIETNRGCPFGCVYCTFGNSTLSKLRLVSLEQVYSDINYIVEKANGQKIWMVTDANFGIVPRDIEIAQRLGTVMDENDYPYEICMWDVKNASKRTMEIYKRIGAQNRVLIAIQTADPKVAIASGRGKIRFKDILEKVDHFHAMNWETKTDIILGLPGESAESHFYTLKTAFDMGFDWFVPTELRLLQGTVCEEEEYRGKYEIQTKYRPMYGAYGVYDDRIVFELDEVVRGTADMTEEEMSNFKVQHFLIIFGWSSGLLKPLLKLGQKNGVNPLIVIDQLTRTENPVLRNLFDMLRTGISNEYFATPEAMISHYEKPENFDSLVKGFYKLTYYYSALVHKDRKLFEALVEETASLLTKELKSRNKYDPVIMDDMIKLTDRLICKDLLSEEFSTVEKHRGKNLRILLNDESLARKKFVDVEVYRSEEVSSFCKAELMPGGEKDLSMHNLTRFLEVKGLEQLSNLIGHVS